MNYLERMKYDHPKGRYCGEQMCCWGEYGKKPPPVRDSRIADTRHTVSKKSPKTTATHKKWKHGKTTQ